METKLFNPSEYKGKLDVSVKSKYTGIRLLYKWDDDQKKYLKKSEGKKYCAIIKSFGRQREKHFDRLEDALRWRQSGGKEELVQKSFLFGELLDKYLAHIEGRINSSSNKTYQNRSKHLKVLRILQVESITPQYIDQWIRMLKGQSYLASQHGTRTSYQKEISLLGRVFNYYGEYLKDGFVSPVKKRHLQDCIVDQVKYKEAKLKNKTRFMTPDETVHFLLKFKSRSEKDEALFGYYCLAFFQLQTGARIGEAAAMTWEDFDFENGAFIISKSVLWGRGKDAETTIQPYTKTGEPRPGWITGPLKEVLLEWRSVSRNKGLVFSCNGIEPYGFRSIQYHYNKAFEDAGLKFRSTHILRHSFSTEFLRLTKDFISLSKILGHSNTRQTEHYAKVTGSMAEDSFEKYKDLNSESMGRVINFKAVAG